MYWLFLFIGIPLTVLSIWKWQYVRKQRRALGWTFIGSAVGGWAWDVLAVRLGAWYYKETNIVNIWVGGLPLEEWLWIAGVTFMFGIITILLKERAS